MPAFELSLLAKKCTYVTRPSLFAYVAERSELEETADDLFAALAGGIVKADIGLTLPLTSAREAHRALEARETVGSTLLLR